MMKFLLALLLAALPLTLFACPDHEAEPHGPAVPADAGRTTDAAAERDAGHGSGTPTYGDARGGVVACMAKDDACIVDEVDAVCCYEEEPSGACISRRNSCGIDDQGYGCDGPEDCSSGTSCCLLEVDRTAVCLASCEQETLCHTSRDCAGHERCEAAGHGYGRCVSDDDKTTPGHDGVGQIFCGNERVCAADERCCSESGEARCQAACDSEQSIRECDGPEDCAAPELCAIDGLAAHCIDPAGMSTDGEPFVCHTSSDCSGYGCEPREQAPELGFCDPSTGT